MKFHPFAAVLRAVNYTRIRAHYKIAMRTLLQAVSFFFSFYSPSYARLSCLNVSKQHTSFVCRAPNATKTETPEKCCNSADRKCQFPVDTAFICFSVLSAFSLEKKKKKLHRCRLPPFRVSFRLSPIPFETRLRGAAEKIHVFNEKIFIVRNAEIVELS